MPADLNRVTVIGRLTRDPELRHMPSGDALCTLRLAVNGRARDEQGNWGDKPNFFDVVVFGRQAENANTYLAKGRRIGVDGRLQWREWQAQDGTRRQSVEIVANDVMFLDGRGDDGGGSPGGGWPQGREASNDMPSGPAPTPPAAGGDDDIPF